MSEMPHKYTHIQTLTGLVSSLIEACPGAQSQLKPSLLIKTMNSSSMNQVRYELYLFCQVVSSLPALQVLFACNNNIKKI